MAYNKTTWVNKKTALSAANLNNIENGVEDVDLRTTKLEEDIKNIDVSEQINVHNTDENAHQDIRNAIENIDVSSQIDTHNSNADAHSSILGIATLNTEDKTVKGAINETLNKVGVLSKKALTIGKPLENINIRDFILATNEPCTFWLNGSNVTGTPIEGKFYTGQLFVNPSGDKHITLQEFDNNQTGKQYYGDMWNGTKDFKWKCDSDEITALQAKVNNLADNAFNADHVYKDLPMGRSLFLSTGLFGDSGMGGNVLIEKTRWYVKETISREGDYPIKYRIMSDSQSAWGKWKSIATTDKIDISSKLVGGWKVLDENCTLEANIIGGVLFVNGLIKNDGTSVVCLDLSEYPPIIKKWHGGLAIGSNGVSKWFVIDPYGSVQFQGGHELGLAYSIHFNYRVY